jgi:hypothetical protein
MPTSRLDADNTYLNILMEPLAVCKQYRPKFGHGSGLTLAEYQTLYQSDPFYTWFGLDSPLLYAAHKASGGMTSLYRQIGIGCQRLIQRIIMDTLGHTVEQSTWSYQATKRDGKVQTLSLDGRILIDAVSDQARRPVLKQWLRTASKATGTTNDVRRILKGAVFEVRQGYKSKDSKRQNADLANAASAYAEAYLPVLLMLSMQIDDDIAYRYTNARWLILRGTTTGTALTSTYVFCRDELGYDLAGFFERNSQPLKQEVEAILEKLLT